MFRVILTILLAAIAVAAYFVFYEDADFLNTKPIAKVQPVANIAPTALQPKAPVSEPVKKELTATAAPKLNEAQKIKAKEHVASITNKEQEPLEITTANHFVTADQVLQLPELKAPEIAKIESANSNTALIVSAPSETTANLNDVQKNAENASTAQSFAVQIPTFKKPIVEAVVTDSGVAQPVVTETTSKKTRVKEIAVKDKTISKELKTTAIAKTVDVKTSAAENSKIKVLGTVTGSIEPEKVTLKSTAIKSVVITNNLAEKNESLMSVIKDNLAELSDIKVSELSEIVADKITGQEPVVAKKISVIAQTAVKTAPATIQNAEAASVAVTSVNKKVAANLSENNRIKLRELLSDTDSDTKRIFYLHAVNLRDEQGIWGIIQQGLMGTFSKGITLSQANGEVRALIPQDADEVLGSKKSSFLGKLLNNKVLTTYVYNYEQGYIGKNPDIIQPGQQLIIVTFTEDELMSVYQHFKDQQQ